MIKDTKHFCMMPFLHYEIKTTGQVAPCCVSRTVYQDETSIPFNVSNVDIDTIVNSDDAVNMRKELLQDKPVRGCQECYIEEERGNVTRRQRENKKYFNRNVTIDSTNFTHRYIDLKLGNLCNLACRICNSWSSSRWVDDYRQAGINTDTIFQSKQNVNFKWYESDIYWNKLNSVMEQIDQIDIYGGEPFLIKQQFKFLETLVESGHSKHISLNYATNGTVYPEHALKNIWPHFERVTLLFSADGVNETFEYARYPAKWDVFENTLSRFVWDNGYRPLISYSVSNYSIWNLMDSFKYYYNTFNGEIKLWLNLVYDNGSNCADMPEELKQKLLQHLDERWDDKYHSIIREKTWEGILNHIKSPQTPHDWEKFKRNVKTYDKVRQQNITDIIPQLHGYLN